ncbi:hypothetical protein [Falsiroseomonas oryzae]|uniref:hypothetical protein n=1 Tax=Falsiroseomonas oryzae TaxID=2766473 RepID=UPI0022EA7C68|nr:hypothetical protein [Roseomonas sp. MO-31]
MSLRDIWASAKKQYKSEISMMKLSDSLDFGPKLDKYEEKKKEYEKTEEKYRLDPKPEKTAAAKKAVKDAAKVAQDAAMGYLKALNTIKGNTAHPQHAAAQALYDTINPRILSELNNAVNGRF